MPNRRISLLFLAPLALIAAMVQSAFANERDAIAAISRHFAAVPTMTGEFIQFAPNGQQVGGTFYIQRPGRIRLDYEAPSPLMMVSNGKTLAVNNRKLKTWDFYPLSKTPLDLLLADRLEIDNKSIKQVEAGEDITTVVMGDKRIFGDSVITLLFDPQTQELRQWTIKDAQGKETSVMIFNVQENVRIPKRLFKIDQLAIQRAQQERGGDK